MGFDGFDDDGYRAENLRPKLANFVDAFDPQDANPVCERLIRNENELLKAGQVDKQPERFTRENLISPCLRALGYKLRGNPAELTKDETKKPDIRLTNLGDEHVGIVECKAINEERSREAALDSLEHRYLEENAFARYKKTLEQRYLVGIATDGFDWKIRVKDLESGDRRSEFEGRFSLVDDMGAIQHFYYKRYQGKTNYAAKDTSKWTRIRKQLAEEFVADFGVHNLPESD